jgi:hypothetical protein
MVHPGRARPFDSARIDRSQITARRHPDGEQEEESPMAVSDEIKEEYRQLAADLKTQRDEIKVRAHLLRMEAAEEWQAVEKKYEHLRGKLKKASEEAGASSEGVKAAVELLATEIKASFRRIKKSL